jgi:hypothetical protein
VDGPRRYSPLRSAGGAGARAQPRS